jgi:hypothetical protein
MHWMTREPGFDSHKARERYIKTRSHNTQVSVRYLVSDFTTKTMFIFLISHHATGPAHPTSSSMKMINF